MSSSKLHYFGYAVCLTLNITFVLTYTVAVSLDHIVPFFSYISDTGTFPPESSIFGLGLSITSFLMAACTYIRYNQVASFLHQKSQQEFPTNAHFWNKVGMILGFTASLGVCVVGAFQITSQIVVHVIGATMAFAGGSIFLLVQAYLSKIMVTQFGSRRLVNLRIFLGCACGLLYLATLATGGMSLLSFSGEESEPLMWTMFKWEPRHGGFWIRLPSVIMEWVMVAFFEIYFLTFVPEFKKISFEPPKFHIVSTSTEKTKNGRSPSVELNNSVVPNLQNV